MSSKSLGLRDAAAAAAVADDEPRRMFFDGDELLLVGLLIDNDDFDDKVLLLLIVCVLTCTAEELLRVIADVDTSRPCANNNIVDLNGTRACLRLAFLIGGALECMPLRNQRRPWA